MTNATHTPGPWLNTGKDGCIIKNGVDTIVCTVNGDCTQGSDKDNARLIAAAPELLEALKEMQAAYTECLNELHRIGAIDKERGTSMPANYGEWLAEFSPIKKATAAIAKAEGN